MNVLQKFILEKAKIIKAFGKYIVDADVEELVTVHDEGYHARFNNVVVELYWCGEGWCGDYDEDDPHDLKLMRFDVSLVLPDGKCHEVDDASYCTQIAVSDPDEVKRKALAYITEQYAAALSSARDGYIPSVKRLGEHLSWIGPHWFAGDTVKSQESRELWRS